MKHKLKINWAPLVGAIIAIVVGFIIAVIMAATAFTLLHIFEK